jgi:SAM-dependent methyltransferase
MGKQDLLSADELSAHTISATLLAAIERCRERMGLRRCAMRVLDFGCGRGRTVAKLIEAGYDAYGVDAAARVLDNARPLFRERGWDAEGRLRLTDVNGKTDFANGDFHAVISEQVLEHVGDLKTAVAELFRITAPGGCGDHIFSSPLRLVEEHLHMPFVHWLPKNAIRYAAIRLCVAVGCAPGWAELDRRSTREQALAYYDYSCAKTHYRNWRVAQSVFESAGFTAHFDVPLRPTVASRHAAFLRATRLCGWRVYREVYLASVVLALHVNKPA